MRESYSLLEWVDLKCFLLFSCVLLLLLEFLRNQEPRNFPPGPRALPLIGNLHLIDTTRSHLQFTEFAKKYGNIFSITIFGPRAIIVNGYKLVKELYVDQGDHFVDRPIFPLFYDIYKDRGLVSSSGYAWKQQRRFALTTLRNFGLGKKSLESSIHLECRYLIEAMSNEQEKSFNPQFLINNAVSNVICVLVFGSRFEYSNSEFQALLKMMNQAVYLEGTMCAQMYNMFPWIMRRVPGPHQSVLQLWSKVIDYVKVKVEEHKMDCDFSNPRDYIDCFLEEVEKQKHDKKADFSIENLCFCAMDLFIAGTETTSTTLYWALLYMINYPEIQAKVQAEIDQVVGSSRQPSIMDRDNLPYTNAVIHEIQRMGNIIPFNLARTASKDIQIGEYTIPKGAMVFGNLTSVLFDETEWETPKSFNPGHFLNNDGTFRRREAFMPFSAGKRVCLGEQLARMELFLFFSSMLQQFTFKPPEGVEPSLEFKLGATHCPKPYQLCAVPR